MSILPNVLSNISFVKARQMCNDFIFKLLKSTGAIIMYAVLVAFILYLIKPLNMVLPREFTSTGRKAISSSSNYKTCIGRVYIPNCEV